jgi:cytochrome c oxidase subunit 4
MSALQARRSLIATVVYFALLLLLALTLKLAYVDLGGFNTPLSLAIACAKAALVALFFMQLKWASGAQRSFAVAGLIWLGILLALSLGDYFSRSALSLPGKWPG